MPLAAASGYRKKWSFVMSEPFVGEIRLFGFQRVPTGWLPCNGQLLSIADYDVLFALIGAVYGGNGQNTFALPDLRGQLPVHQGSGPGLTPRALGQAGGLEAVTLLANQLPAHSHPLHATTATAEAAVPGTGVELGSLPSDKMYATDIIGTNPLVMGASSISQTGGNLAHDNLMPTQTVSFCIAYQGIFPTQN